MQRVLSVLLCFCLILGGCLPSPRKGDGRLSLRVSWGDKAVSRGVEEIAAVEAYLTRQGLTITKSLDVDQANKTAGGTIEGLYAGEWTVRVDAAKADGTVIYTGSRSVNVVSGATTDAALTLAPAPGELDISLDITPLIAAGHEVAEGKVYIYKPDSGNSSSYEMLREGGNLRGLVGNLASITYDARVAVPQMTNSIFTSRYFQFDILPGRTTRVHLAADGEVSVDVTIIDQPGRVEGMRAHADGEQAILSWIQTPGATGYRVYRTDGDGRFRLCGTIEDGAITSYIDLEFGRAEAYGGIIQYAVAALTGPVEGLRSEPVAVPRG